MSDDENVPYFFNCARSTHFIQWKGEVPRMVANALEQARAILEDVALIDYGDDVAKLRMVDRAQFWLGNTPRPVKPKGGVP